MSNKTFVYLHTYFPEGGYAAGAFAFEHFILPDDKKKYKKAKKDIIHWNIKLNEDNKEREKFGKPIIEGLYWYEEETFNADEIIWSNQFVWYPKIYSQLF